MKIPSIQLLGYPVFSESLSAIPWQKKLVINTINGHSYTVAKSDLQFRKALQESDVLLPDGASVVMGMKMLQGQNIQKIAGYDLFIFLMDYLNQRKGKCFFLGSMDHTLDKMRSRAMKEFPNVQIGSFSPPYKPVFSAEDNRIMQDQVNQFKPDVLFVGMTAPKQEKWVNDNKNKLDAGAICSIGAVFDFYAGTSNRPPQWMINLKLEWLGRLLKEPKRMWKRYLLSTPVFFIDVFLYKLGFKNRIHIN
ncbi:WecB/TagA/CpsF family glycosyltransferase [Sunxiuqinia elliptica]|uniref:N-acetylglucosaminyldiphosphoundecaprenol N-acetyl-beta-D-mannosaminyltransferase n=1 Tax=Sunxiuqinia elliptica TaxID=655355 RepID=A0A4R6H5D9_9BACT|nr:WecB/TagA/CpsF family glycosyltransferase [Sunxiuqinia elliptica]TDO02666.1 N-acetylglucosaminyldiphosphoundecaprenol N-acetyl-beta-D-mannosaminyltransferase [Sunxiuqinia elliptica]TDO58596.1 N-acetylglucosaminyldiphosphoundecaprenol N-acetyl-beta-D-mannosaminyltransferase [Sunxiuqinia elliptica]